MSKIATKYIKKGNYLLAAFHRYILSPQSLVLSGDYYLFSDLLSPSQI